MFRAAAVGLLVLGALAAPSVLTSSGGQTVDGALRSVTLFNLPEGVSEGAFVDAFRGLNEAVHSTGHIDAGYSLFKVVQARVEDAPPIGRDYILIGHWPSQAVYDEIHESAAYVEAGERYGQVFAALEQERQYSRYEALSVGGPGEH
jgi:hypothetical protein